MRDDAMSSHLMLDLQMNWPVRPLSVVLVPTEPPPDLGAPPLDPIRGLAPSQVEFDAKLRRVRLDQVRTFVESDEQTVDATREVREWAMKSSTAGGTSSSAAVHALALWSIPR